MALISFSRRKPTVGLDIGSGLVKAAVIDHTGAEPELIGAAISPLSDDAIVDGEVMDPGAVAEAVRSCLEAAGAKGREVVTAVGGRDVIVKKIQAERTSEKEAREVMRWEAQQHVPFDDLDSVELDFQILDPDAQGSQMQVLLVAAKRELIEAKLRLLAEGGANAAVVDVDAFALHNAFELNHGEGMSGIVALVNIGHDVTNINIIENGVPVLTRDVAVGTRRLREDLQRERGLTAEDAIALITGYDRSPHVDAVLPDRVEEIALTVERAAAFLFSNMRTGAALRSVYTCGGGSRTPGLNAALAQRLKVSVESANPLANLGVRPGALGRMIVDEVAPLLVLPIGLALRQN
jgi:type IV pilus assembly protein PilM